MTTWIVTVRVNHISSYASIQSEQISSCVVYLSTTIKWRKAFSTLWSFMSCLWHKTNAIVQLIYWDIVISYTYWSLLGFEHCIRKKTWFVSGSELIRKVSSKGFPLFHHTYPVWCEIDAPFPALPKQVWQAVCIAEHQLYILIGHQDTKEMRNENKCGVFLKCSQINSRLELWFRYQALYCLIPKQYCRKKTKKIENTPHHLTFNTEWVTTQK